LAHITAAQVQVWLETTKATISTVDPALETQIAGEVIGRLAETFPAEALTWTDNTNTPEVVQQIISMFYASWFYDRQFSEVETGQTSYGATLRAWATKLLQDVITGGVILVGVVVPASSGPAFYPTDQSSTWDAWRANTDCNDKSLGPAKFGMGMVF
jgi:hypothetical protein